MPDTSYVNQTISSDTIFRPLARRDTAYPGPDLGYHYDPIDYAFSGVVVNNASVTVGPGTVIGTFGTNGSPYGLSIGSGAQLISDGTAAQPCRIVTYNTVQEGPGGGWQAPTLASVTDYIGGAGGMFDFQFTDWSMFGPANASHLIIDQSNPVNMRDCQFHGGSLVTYLGPTINLTNCLFDRVYLALYPDDANTPVLRNNLFYGGTLDLLPFVTSHSVVQDNLFDRTTILDYNPPCTYTGYNAYVTNCNRLQPTTTYDIILTNSPAYQTGPLGNYYQPTNSPLIDRGSENVDDAGLTGYTILTNQTPDTGTVDIGFHYRDFAIRPGFNQNILGANDDGSTGLINVPFTLNFFGTPYSALYVNNNGNVTFERALGTYTPKPLGQEASQESGDIIAPFWADVDTRAAGSAPVTYGTCTVDSHAAFGVNWIYVGYYDSHDDKLNVFQLVLIDRSDRATGDYDVEFNYAQIKWEAGDVSGGCDGLWIGEYPHSNCEPNNYGFSVRAGYATASAGGSSFEINGSAVAGALLDSNLTTGLIHTSFNSTVPGRYVFQFHNGVPLGTP